MAIKYLDLTFTDSVRRAQKDYYGRTAAIESAPERDPLGKAETDFIAARDSFYLGTVNRDGWPYVQHRGGPTGFLKVLNPTTLAFADYKGNRQLLSTGNLSDNDRVALFLMDYPNRTRLKILGRARVVNARTHPELLAQVADPTMKSRAERLMFIDVVSYDWNCPSHITPRYSVGEVQELVQPLKERIGALEAELRAVKA
jgi:predicted pyridoxine 5'-phosphate oxidase superfamily flavin-nucleotide-binding protein